MDGTRGLARAHVLNALPSSVFPNPTPKSASVPPAPLAHLTYDRGAPRAARDARSARAFHTASL